LSNYQFSKKSKDIEKLSISDKDLKGIQQRFVTNYDSQAKRSLTQSAITKQLEIIESVLKQEQKPLNIFRTHTYRFTDLVIKAIIDGINTIINNRKAKFPKFNLKLHQTTEEFLNKLKTKFLEVANNVISAQEEYIWTEDEKFNNTLNSFDIADKIKTDFDMYETQHEYESYETKIRRLLKSYLESIKRDLKNFTIRNETWACGRSAIFQC
jgi:hypothetical protein